jgi:hypothetical protein
MLNIGRMKVNYINFFIIVPCDTKLHIIDIDFNTMVGAPKFNISCNYINMFSPRDWRLSIVGKIKWKHWHMIDATNKVDVNIQFQVGDVVTSLLKTSLWSLVEGRMCMHSH